MTLDERLSEASERFENPEPQIAAAVAEFCKNPYWREYYEKATGHAKEYIGLEFWNSSMRDDDPCKSQCIGRIEFVEGRMSSLDWKYVYDHAKAGGAMGMALAKYRKTFDNFCVLADDHLNRLKGEEGWL